MDMEVISKFLESFLLALAPVLASLFAAWLALQVKKVWAQLKEANPDVAYWLAEAAQMAVAAAEQSQLAGLISDKKAYALEIAEKYLKENYNVDIDLHLIEAAIEAEVLKNHVKFDEIARMKVK